MAKLETAIVERTPVEERGVALLQRIKDSPNGFLMLNQDEGKDIVSEGLATIRDGSDQPDGTVAVSLTPKGEATLGAAPEKAKGTKRQLAVSAGVDSDIPPPALGGARRGPNGGSKYPFDTMEVNQSFHIPKTDEQPDPLGSIQTSISQAHAKFAVDDLDADGKQQMVQVIEKTYQKDTATGKIAVDADGHRIVTATSTVMKPKQKYSRTFVGANVDATDPKGVGARVWRTA